MNHAPITIILGFAIQHNGRECLTEMACPQRIRWVGSERPPPLLTTKCCGCRLNGSPENDEGAVSALERKAKALRKKIKQAGVLVERQAAGDKLTVQEIEKVQKCAIW
jgi:hypothetical protein